MNRFLLFLTLILSCAGKPQSTENKLPGNEKEVVCFVYHRFGDSRYPTTNTSVRDFESHLSYLTKNNFQVLTFSEAIDYLKSDKPIRKTAVITIDDGYKTFFDRGLPLLKKYKLPATLFINTKTVAPGGDMMSWPEIEEAHQNNIEIGNHTHTHDYFLNKSVASRYETFRKEIELSQSIIKENLNITPIVFTFPYGEFDPEMKKIVIDAGFKGAAAQNSGVMYAGGDLFMCPRFPMSEAYSAREKFVEKAGMKALRIESVSPESFLLTDDKRPLLTLTIQNTNLRTDQLQCFVQGGAGELTIIRKSEDNLTITVQAKKAISGRRRTLYTVTVPDKKGVWHWYSHLWINPKIEGE